MDIGKLARDCGLTDQDARLLEIILKEPDAAETGELITRLAQRVEMLEKVRRLALQALRQLSLK